ncbi:nickel pincer cofactor biosynthesis protein LarC [Virgibacillus xinjiangensis]|uniref:Nickel pincer cofactor biosynthesis protein LarC n=1 Tax=Virgibacillus xinjiangensis TaxID=393090 RepID=A0ABV7CSX2_9BACI
MSILYFDCFSGISGDMTIGSLIDAGADASHLKEELKKLKIENEYELKWTTVNKNGITSTKFDVILQEENHSHEEGQSHGEDVVEHTHTHHDGSHSHEHHHHHHGHHHHEHRTYKDIVRMIEESGLEEGVKATALRIFTKIGEAEGKIHGQPLDQVHFHEVGAVDSIIDIVGTAILIHQLGVETIVCSPIPVGGGKIHIDHGIYPVPAPATLEILRGVPIMTSNIKGELTTPTGAAIAAVLAEDYGAMPSMEIKEIGYGAGSKTFKNHPNVLRTVIGK